MEIEQPPALDKELVDKKDELHSLEVALEATIQDIYKCSSMIDEGSDSKNEVYCDELNKMLKGLENLDDQGRKLEDAFITRSLLNQVDAGLNPNALTKHAMNQTTSRNDTARGRLFATKILVDQLTVRKQAFDRSNPSSSTTPSS